MPQALTKKAVIYLRVSTQSQVKTDYDPEGLSIPAQREACCRKAKSLGATVVEEFKDEGVSGGSLVKRDDFKKMVEYIDQKRDIDFAIVWSVKRWARNQEDHWTARGMIRRAGAKLQSVKEPIGDDTSHGVMIEGVMAAASESRKIEDSEDIRRGIQRKVDIGGTPGRAPTGYINYPHKLPDGTEVRTVKLDKERAPLVQWAFEAYATGHYSLSDMATLLDARGLRTRSTPKLVAKPLTPSGVHSVLSHPYYTGRIRHKGKVYPGRHERLISDELFDQVQTVLAAHRLSGERNRKHDHYLKGSIRCDHCHRRLTYSRNKGNGGVYEYFLCPANQVHECPQAAQRVDVVEEAIERYYHSIRMSEQDLKRVRRAMETNLVGAKEVFDREIQRCQGVLDRIKDEERKLLHMHYQDQVSEELFAEEQQRMRQQRKDAETIIAGLTMDADDLKINFDLALQLIGSDLASAYAAAPPHLRRVMNQAIFKAIYLSHDEATGAKLASPFREAQTVRDAARAIAAAHRERQTADSQPDSDRPHNAKTSAPDLETEALVGGSISAELVELVGLEPTTSWVRSRHSSS